MEGEIGEVEEGDGAGMVAMEERGRDWPGEEG